MSRFNKLPQNNIILTLKLGILWVSLIQVVTSAEIATFLSQVLRNSTPTDPNPDSPGSNPNQEGTSINGKRCELRKELCLAAQIIAIVITLGTFLIIFVCCLVMLCKVKQEIWVACSRKPQNQGILRATLPMRFTDMDYPIDPTFDSRRPNQTHQSQRNHEIFHLSSRMNPYYSRSIGIRTDCETNHHQCFNNVSGPPPPLYQDIFGSPPPNYNDLKLEPSSDQFLQENVIHMKEFTGNSNDDDGPKSPQGPKTT